MGNNLKTFEEIADKYSMVLVDTCAFQEICNSSEPYSIEKKIPFYIIRKKSFEFWKNNFEKYRNCYIILEVFKELNKKKNYRYKKIIKNQPSRKESVNDLRKIKSLMYKEKRNLIMFLEDKNKILNFNGEKQNLYEEFFNDYSFLRSRLGTKKKNKEKNPFYTDFKLLISGGVLSIFNGSTSLISNDSGICKAWRKFLKKEGIFRKQFNFYFRIESDKFIEAY